jgi:hypothetical protein
VFLLVERSHQFKPMPRRPEKRNGKVRMWKT